MTNNSSTTKTHFTRLIYESMLWRGLFFLSALLLNLFIARTYHASASGRIFYIFNYYTLFIEVLGFSMETGINYYASKKEIPVSKLLGFSLVLALAALVPVVIFFGLYVPGELRGLPTAFILFSAGSYVCGYILNNCCSAIFYAGKNFILPNVVVILINLSLVVLLFITGGGGTNGINNDLFTRLLFASFFVQGIVLFVSAFILLSGGRGLSFPGKGQLQKIGRYSLQAFVANIAFFLLYRIDYWFVEKYCSADELGNYIQVAKLVQLFMILPAIMGGVIFPSTAGGQKKEVNKHLKAMAISLLALYGIVCGVLALTGSWLFPFLFGSSFDKMYIPFLLLIPGILSLSMLHPFTAYYAGKNLVRINISGALLSLLVIIPGDIIFIPRYGIAAAALVSSAGYMVYQLYVMAVYKKEFRIAGRDFFSVTRTDLYWIRDMVINNFFKRNSL